MTKEEAIVFLRQVQQIMLESNSWLESTHEPIKEAFDMAIDALEQEEIIRCDSCRYKLWDAFSYPCIDCGRGFLHYEATNDTMPSEICGLSVKA